MDIVKDVLELCLDTPQLKSAIMYRANLSYRQLEAHLRVCVKNELLKKQIEGSRVVYTTTKKGMKFLEVFGMLKSLMCAPVKEQNGARARMMVKRDES